MEKLNNIKVSDYKYIGYFFISYLFILVVNGALPFYGMPTLGQVVLASGYSESFLNQGINIYANDFGIPVDASMSFGLPGAFLQALLMKILKLHASDGYTLTFSIFLLLALIGNIKTSVLFGASKVLSVLLSILYLTLPMVWWHSSYSFLQLGYALLPLYIYYGFRISTENYQKFSVENTLTAILFCAVSVLSIFMDGYTFTMFATATFIIYLYENFQKIIAKDFSSLINLFFILCSFGLSYFLYTTYIGVSSYEKWPIDYFRGFGVDIVMLLWPSAGIHWVWDVIGLSDYRSGKEFFGDASVWSTTFSFFLIVFGSISFFIVKNKIKYPLAAIALVAFYFALGPSLKIDSTRPVEQINANSFPHGMQKEYAVMRTGSEIFYKNLPGFKSMRATYRWAGLMQFALWAMIALAIATLHSRNSKYGWIGLAVVIFLIINNLPNLEKKLEQSKKNKESMLKIDEDVVKVLENKIPKNSKVAFVPYYNDHFVNYLAAKSKIKTYNIGGDKNLELAKKNWPETMLAFSQIKPGSNFIYNIEKMLVTKDADYVVFSYFDLLWGAYSWPRSSNEINQRKKMFSEYMQYFKNNPNYETTETELMFFITLSDKVNIDQLRTELKNKTLCVSQNAVCFDASRDKVFTQAGKVENGQVVSDKTAGTLLFGPYKAISKGKYTLKVYGENISNSNFRVQIVHDLGRKVVHQYLVNLSKPYDDEGVVFYKENIEIDSDISNLEIKVIIDDNTDLKISGYQFIKEPKQ